jgi:subtilisin family serine protease
MVLTTTKTIIEEITQRPEVERIEENYLIYLEPFKIEGQLVTEPPSTPIWSISRVGAPDAWAAGYNGQGIVIGFIDTGVDTNHPALKDNFTGFWFDAVNDSLSPYDDIGHGTHVVGTACGKFNIGVAPGAKFMMAKVFGGPNNAATIEAIHRAFQWYAEMKNPPKILSNSWGNYNQYDLTFWQDILTIRSLGIIPVFALGNGGNWGLIASPGDYPNVIGVGATTIDDSVADFSSRGPAPFDAFPWNDTTYWPRRDWHYIKPNISAPGENILSSLPGGTYGYKSGTSMSCPNVAGCIAILLEKYPNLTFEEVYNILVDSASKIFGINFPNNDYGWGG